MVVVLRISNPSARPSSDKKADFPTPFVVSDITPYKSPIDGREITSRSQRRDDLRANGCVEWEPGMSKREAGYSNPTFALKRGLPLNERGQENLRKMKEEKKNGSD